MEERDMQDIPPEIQPLTGGEIRPVEPKRLTRSTDNRLFLGVAGGLGEYFDVDPTLVRIAFVVGTLLAGSAVVVYIVLALIMPSEATLDAHPRESARRTVDEATTEVKRGVDFVVTKARELTSRRSS